MAAGVITHNAFVGLERSRAIVRRAGLDFRVAATTLLYVPDNKLDFMTESVMDAENGKSIHRYGPYTFAKMHIAEIGHSAVLG